MAEGTNGRSGYESKLRWIGDLDHPFYDDERQRFIWYEASTIAFQIFLFANVALAGLMLWIGGAQAVSYAVAVMAVQAVAGGVAIGYARANYAEYVPKPSDLLSGRNLIYGGLVLFAGGGLVRALLDLNVGARDSAVNSFFGGAVEGLIAGLVSTPVVVGIVIALKRRKAAAEDD